jgi:hypothetical protein
LRGDKEAVTVLVTEAARRSVPPLDADEVSKLLQSAFSQEQHLSDDIPMLSDLGNARRLESLLMGNVIFVHNIGWYAYQRNVWQLVPQEHIINLAWQLPAHILDDLPKARDEAERQALVQWGIRSASYARILASVELLRGMPSIWHAPGDLDLDATALQAQNGVVNLRDKSLITYDTRVELITHQVNSDYNTSASAPQWEQFLADILPDTEV